MMFNLFVQPTKQLLYLLLLPWCLANNAVAETSNSSGTPKFDVPPAMVGTWQNNTQGNILGININADASCNVFVERALKPRSDRKCRFEPFEETYSVFLYNEHGVCNFSPDFEFSFDADAPLVHFKIGSNPIPLSKQP